MISVIFPDHFAKAAMDKRRKEKRMVGNFVIFGSKIKSAICGELASLANSIVTDQKLQLSQSSQNQHLFILKSMAGKLLSNSPETFSRWEYRKSLLLKSRKKRENIVSAPSFTAKGNHVDHKRGRIIAEMAKYCRICFNQYFTIGDRSLKVVSARA